MLVRDATLAPARRRPFKAPVLTAWPAALLIAVVPLAGCEINKPDMPSFSSTLALPLGVERLEASEAVDSEDNLTVAEDGQLLLQFAGDPDTLDFTCDLTTEVDQQTIGAELGNFSLSASDSLDHAFTLAEIWPPAAVISGQPAVIPMIPIDVASPPQDIPDIESATLAEGSLSVTVRNGLPVPISANWGAGQLVLTLTDPGTGQAVAELVFALILPGESVTEIVDLAGCTLPDAFIFELQGTSFGSSGEVVLVDGGDAIGVTARLSDLVVSAAVAVVEPQEFQADFTMDLPCDYAITRAVIASGHFTVDLRNDLAVPCNATLHWPELYAAGGQPLSAEVVLPPGAAATRILDLAGAIIQTADQPLTALDGQLTVTTPGSAGQTVPLDAGATLTAELAGSQIVFTSITGTVPLQTWDLDPVTEELDLPEELAGLELVAGALALQLTNTADLPADLNLTVTGTAADGVTSVLQVTEQIDPATERGPATTTIVLDQTNSTILDMLNSLPETIALAGSVSVGGDDVNGTVRAGDYAVVVWELRAPLAIVLTGSTITGDPSSLNVDADIQEKIRDKALGAEVALEVFNHLPAGFELRLLASPDTASIRTEPLLELGPLTIQAAEVDPLTGVVRTATISRPKIALDQAQARSFGLPGLHTLVEVTLPAGDGNPVTVMATDYVEVRGIVSLEVQVDDKW